MIILLLSWITRQKICKMTTIPLQTWIHLQSSLMIPMQFWSYIPEIIKSVMKHLKTLLIQDKSQGILFEQNLAYKKDVKDNGYIYAFVDISIAKSNFYLYVSYCNIGSHSFNISVFDLNNFVSKLGFKTCSSILAATKSSSWQMLLMNLKPR